MDELLVVGAAEPAGVQAAAESHFHVVAVIGGTSYASPDFSREIGARVTRPSES